MTSHETITIPAEIVPHVQREALFLIWRVGDEIGGLQERLELDRGAITDALGRLDRSRALLDALGWPAPGSEAVVGSEHRRALLDGLRVSMNVTAGMARTAREEGNNPGAQQRGAELDGMIDYAAAVSGERGDA